MQDQVLLEILNQLKKLNETSEILMQQNERIIRDINQLGEVVAQSNQGHLVTASTEKTSNFLDALVIR